MLQVSSSSFEVPTEFLKKGQSCFFNVVAILHRIVLTGMLFAGGHLALTEGVIDVKLLEQLTIRSYSKCYTT